MPNYHSITSDEEESYIADAVVMRERELLAYDHNIETFNTMLAALPSGDWPADIAQFKNSKNPVEWPDDRVDEIAQLQWRDRVKAQLRTETIQRSNSASALDANVNRIAPGRLVAAIASAKTRLNGANG